MALQREAIEIQNKLKAAKKEYQDVHDRISSKHGFNGAQVITEVSFLLQILKRKRFILF